MNAPDITPMVTWGTNPEQACAVTGVVPNPRDIQDKITAQETASAIDYQGLTPGMALSARVPTATSRIYVPLIDKNKWLIQFDVGRFSHSRPLRQFLFQIRIEVRRRATEDVGADRSKAVTRRLHRQHCVARSIELGDDFT